MTTPLMVPAMKRLVIVAFWPEAFVNERLGNDDVAVDDVAMKWSAVNCARVDVPTSSLST